MVLKKICEEYPAKEFFVCVCVSSLLQLHLKDTCFLLDFYRTRNKQVRFLFYCFFL